MTLCFKAPGRERPFRTPLHVGRLPLLPPLGIVISLALMTQFEPVSAAAIQKTNPFSRQITRAR